MTKNTKIAEIFSYGHSDKPKTVSFMQKALYISSGYDGLERGHGTLVPKDEFTRFGREIARVNFARGSVANRSKSLKILERLKVACFSAI